MLELKNVCYKAEGRESSITILEDISLVLEKNRFYAVTGPNGGGKSTFAKIIMGIIKPSSGTISFNGKDITGLSTDERARLGIAYAFQYPPRFKGLTVRQMLELAAGSRDINICDLLYDVGLCAREYLDREIDSRLSGGEIKRIEIATVLAKDAELAVFDEPEAGIDLWSFKRLAQTFNAMHAGGDGTVVIITHQERILELADEIMLISRDGLERDVPLERLRDSVVRNDSCRCSLNCEKGAGNDAECVG